MDTITVEKTREDKIAEDFAHDFRDMKMSELELLDVLNSVIECVQCEHQCTSNCRREGCNCACGEFHYSND